MVALNSGNVNATNALAELINLKSKQFIIVDTYIMNVQIKTAPKKVAQTNSINLKTAFSIASFTLTLKFNKREKI